MLAELAILLSIANIVLIFLIMKHLSAGFRPKKSRRKAEEEEEEYEEEQPEPEPLPEPDTISKRTAPQKTSRFSIREKLRFGKKEKPKKHLSEMPDMNKVIEELEIEFKKGTDKKEFSRKTKNELQARLEEIEKI